MIHDSLNLPIDHAYVKIARLDEDSIPKMSVGQDLPPHKMKMIFMSKKSYRF